MRKLFLGAIVTLAAGPALAGALPAGISDTDVESFESAMIAVGCSVTNEDVAGSVAAQTGLSENQLTSIVEYMTAEARLVETGDAEGIRLIHADCETQ